MKCLTMCGGGVFGIVQARILDKVDTKKFDFFAGKCCCLCSRIRY